MSHQTWIKEFYPITAKRRVKVGCTELEAAEHSLKKWRGFQPANLHKHHLQAPHGRVCSDGSSCALCQLHDDRSPVANGPDCSKCILTKIRDGTPCHRADYTDLKMAPWHYWSVAGDPKPMLALLKAAVKVLKNERAKKLRPQ